MSLGTRNVSNASHLPPTNSATSSAVRHWRSASSTPGTALEIAARCAGCNATVESTFMDGTNFRTGSRELQGIIASLRSTRHGLIFGGVPRLLERFGRARRDEAAKDIHAG